MASTLRISWLSFEVDAPFGPQFARPDTDTAAGFWLPITGTSLYAMVDETEAVDADYIYSDATPVHDAVDLGLSPLEQPIRGTVTLRVRARVG
jgi:hypothetical protein